MKEWLNLAIEGAVVRRALWCMVIVGAILISINHGDALVCGDFSGKRLIQIGLTLLVPYCVSTFSSVGAMRSVRKNSPPPGSGDNG
jgi:hypothetical protein